MEIVPRFWIFNNNVKLKFNFSRLDFVFLLEYIFISLDNNI
jgi:hypothetical protein